MIPIKGVIGWDVVGVEFAEKLSRLNGDIDFEIDSPGGSVFDGISIFNAIKNYNKGKCNIKVVGDASSMAAYIMLAGDSLKFESNAVVCIHNPWSLCVGDYNAMKEQATLLEKLAALYASKFVEKGLFEEKEIRQLMDAETWFIGSKDLKKLGEVIGVSDDENTDNDDENENAENDRDIKIAACREKMKFCENKVKELNSQNLDKVAALIGDVKFNAQAPTTKEKTQTQCNTQKPKGAKKMDLNELKTAHAELYKQVLAQGAKDERARVSAFLGFIDVDKDATIKAINDGVEITDNAFQASILMAKVKQETIKGMEEGNPPQVDPQQEEHAQEGGEDAGKQAEEEKAKEEQAKKDKASFAKIMELCGVSVDEK